MNSNWASKVQDDYIEQTKEKHDVVAVVHAVEELRNDVVNSEKLIFTRCNTLQDKKEYKVDSFLRKQGIGSPFASWTSS